MSYISYCGIKCDQCPIFIATKTNDEKMKEKLAQEYSSEKCTFISKDMECAGCRSSYAEHSKMCGGCEIRLCGKTRDIITCAECAEYPCYIIEKYVPKGSENRTLLDDIKKYND